MACDSSDHQIRDKGFIQVEGQNFVDPEGRQILFSGINFISKNPEEKYMPPQGKETIEQFKQWGVPVWQQKCELMLIRLEKGKVG